MHDNQELFSILRGFNLPIGQYAITGSGPMGIRDLKIIGDIDIIVSEELWNKLILEYGITDKNGARKVVFPGGTVEAFHQGSFYLEPFDPKAPTYASRIANAEIIDGLPFDTLETILYYKKKERREKDLRDIELIESWFKRMKEKP
jgi:hypothetical protein